MTKAFDDLTEQYILDTFGVSQCERCVHWHGADKCDAFDRIPLEIMGMQFDHTEPYPGDKGIHFEEKDS